MKRKIASILICAAMVATMIAGCGSKEEPAASAPAQSEEPAEAPAESEAEEPAEAPAEAPAGDGGLVTIGFAQVGHESD